MTEDLSPYKEAYITEACEHLDVMSTALLRLEKSPDDPHSLGEIFRAVHTLKSMAGTMNYTETAALSHAVEDCLTDVKNGAMELGFCINLLFKSFDLLEANLKLIETGTAEKETADMVEELKKTAEGKEEIEKKTSPEALRGATQAPLIDKISRINVKVERLDTLMNLAEELLVAKMKLDQTSDKILDTELSANADKMGRLITDLQYHVMQVRLVPVGFIFNRFPRMVRDLAHVQGKEIDLVMEGVDIEVDRGIVDEIGEALVHLIRNAIDHGMETGEERKSKDKKSKGTIRLTAVRTKDNVHIQVQDDGRGLDLNEIRRVAVSKGLGGSPLSESLLGESPLAEKETKDHEKLTALLFSGLSTSHEVTSISGRGIGLPVVKKKMEAIGGSVAVTSSPGEGTLFTLDIPLTMAVIKTLFAQVSGKTYAIPISNVERLVQVAESDVRGQLGTEALVLNGEDVPLIRLANLFKGDSPNDKRSPPPLDVRGGQLQQLPVVVIRRGQELVGLGVDAFQATEEVVVKPLSSLVRKNRYFSGSAVIGSGEVVLILDVGHLALSERRI